MSSHENTAKIVRSLIQVLHDGHRGLAAIGGELKDPTARRYLLEETQMRADFAAELENELHRMGVHDVNEGGTASGTAHRIWGDLKSSLGGGDHTLLSTAEQGEDEAKAEYAAALRETLPGPIRDLIGRQQEHILESHDRIRGFRDSKAR